MQYLPTSAKGILLFISHTAFKNHLYSVLFFKTHVIPQCTKFQIIAKFIKQTMQPPSTPPFLLLAAYAMHFLPLRKDNILLQKTEMLGNDSPPLIL